MTVGELIDHLQRFLETYGTMDRETKVQVGGYWEIVAITIEPKDALAPPWKPEAQEFYVNLLI